MKRSRSSEKKIISILLETDGDSTVKAVLAKDNISDATFYNWKRKYGGMDIARYKIKIMGQLIR